MSRDVFNTARDTVRTQLWPLPLAGVSVAFILGLVLPSVDRHIDTSLPPWLAGVLFSGDPSAARTVLDAVSSSLITVTSLTFSLTVVTLQLASSQFSPRLLRTFTSDVFVQATLGLFLATFTYSLTVLRSVRTSADGQSAFVPRVSVTVSFVLALASVIGLVVFLAHLARQIRVETMLEEVHTDASATLRAVVDEPDRPDRGDGPAMPPRPGHATTMLARSSGFVVRIDEGELLGVTVDADIYVVLDRYPGASVVAGTPIGSMWSDTGPIDPDRADRLTERISHALHVGMERTAVQDIGYGLRQLTDVANKALSPGINDPTTAVHALGHISALLGEIADRDPGPARLSRDDVVRVELARPGFVELLDSSFTQPRRYGGADPQVAIRLFQLLEERSPGTRRCGTAMPSRPSSTGSSRPSRRPTSTRPNDAGSRYRRHASAVGSPGPPQLTGGPREPDSPRPPRRRGCEDLRRHPRRCQLDHGVKLLFHRRVGPGRAGAAVGHPGDHQGRARRTSP